MNLNVDTYLLEGCGRCPLAATPDCKVHPWLAELRELRRIILGCGLVETIKWGVPCYTFQGNKLLILSALKEACVVGFFKGVLLNDPHQLLRPPGKHSQAVRQFRFTSRTDILRLEPILQSYIEAAIEIEKAGLKVEFEQRPEPIPPELQEKLNADAVFRMAFEGLTPGRQRGYIIYFSQAKQSKTRAGRIAKCEAKILNGEGLHDKYQSRGK